MTDTVAALASTTAAVALGVAMLAVDAPKQMMVRVKARYRRR